jgi:hypothetical protein
LITDQRRDGIARTNTQREEAPGHSIDVDT